MFIETALKNYTLEAVLEDSRSFALEDFSLERSWHTVIVRENARAIAMP